MNLLTSKFEWKGDWSDNSSKWTKDVIEQVPNFTRADDGAFWICIQDFTKFFEGVSYLLIIILSKKFRLVYVNSMKTTTIVL